MRPQSQNKLFKEESAFELKYCQLAHVGFIGEHFMALKLLYLE